MNRFLPAKSLLFVLLIAFTFSACSKKDSPKPTPPDTSPTITSLSVTSGPYNTTVVITGTNFSPSKANNDVFFNGKVAVTSDATKTQITALVPLGAGTGNVTVQVIGGKTATGPVFTYQFSVVVSTLAGSGSLGSADGTGEAASFNQPTGLSIDKTGNVFVADEENNLIRKITPDGVVTTIAGTGAIGAANGTGRNASFNLPEDLAVDDNGNLFVADQGNFLVRKITSAGVVTTFAGSGERGYVDGSPVAAKFGNVNGIVIDGTGNLLVSDPDFNAIRKVAANGDVSTFAKGLVNFNFPTDVAVDKSGNVFVADLLNYKVRKITPANVISDLNRATTTTTFNGPGAVTTDANGNVYVIDSNSIVKITTANVVSDYSSGSFVRPQGIAVDAAGAVYVADTGHNRICKISMQ